VNNADNFNMILLILTALIVKHFVVDFPLQKPYQWKNKGTYGHPGGILHAVLHGIGTYLCIVLVTPLAVMLALLDALVHYHVDWAKMNLNRRLQLDPSKEGFWWALGLDQLLHYLTYVVILFLIFY
jgi:hypothetical protein